MSSSRDSSDSQSRYSLWVSERDEQGLLLDPRFVQAAYLLERQLFRYRGKELGCQSVAASLIQATVCAASRAAQLTSVVKPAAYLMTAFKHRVDKYLSNLDNEVVVDDDFMEDLHTREGHPKVAEILNNQILLQQVRQQMDDWTIQVLNMRIAGYSTDEVAKEFKISSNSLSVRYLRGIRKAADRLSNRRSRKRADAK